MVYDTLSIISLQFFFKFFIGSRIAFIIHMLLHLFYSSPTNKVFFKEAIIESL